MVQAPYRLDRQATYMVLESIREVCVVRDWQMISVDVRSTHVHCVVGEIERPNRVVADFKAYASRALNQVEGYRRRWAREGSTRRLLNSAAIVSAVRYVVNCQRDAMAVYSSPDPRPGGTGLWG
jgi:hypothetical protein